MDVTLLIFLILSMLIFAEKLEIRIIFILWEAQMKVRRTQKNTA